MIIRTPDHRLRVFVSSTLKELAEERKAVRQAILKLRLAPVMFESGARPHPPQDLYKSYLAQSQIFIGIYWQSYGWIAPGTLVSGLEDEYNLSAALPSLIYIKNPAPEREPALSRLLDRIRNDNSKCYTYFSTPQELKELVQDDLALLLTEHFESATPAGQPPAETTAHPPTNVPVPRNLLIGREGELAKACSLLLRDDIALVTLTGAGGTGKSRLAIQIGLELLNSFKDGVYLVRLEPISDPDLVISMIAETLGIREAAGGRPLPEMLQEFLREKQMLLLLDNFEQVVSIAPAIGELLEACPRLKSIVTSRTPLRLRAEKELPVSPLAVPSPQEFANLTSLSQYAAVELFIQRAQAVRPDFTVTNANAPAVAEICYRLDGLPLAIELAAARIKLLTPHELLSRLEHRFELLRSGTRDLPERQRTLRGAIDWSYNLLNEEEKKLFRRLSIFVGGWTLDAAETVCDLDGDITRCLDDTLSSLIDNNLVFPAQESGEQSRFGMLSTIHEYARERLMESDEADRVYCQHAWFYLEFVKTIEPLLRSAERVHWLGVMRQEFGNIRGVLEWITTTGNCIETGQKIVTTLGMFWVIFGYIGEGQQWCAQILSMSDESTPVPTRAGLLFVAGTIAWAQGAISSSATSLDDSVELLRKLPDKTLDEKNWLARSMIIQALAASSSRDLKTATELLESGIEIFKETKDQWYHALALSFLGDVAQYENDSQRALSLHNESIQLARQQGDPWCLMPALMASAQIALMDGDILQARSILHEAVALLRTTGDQWSLLWALNDLGHVALMEGDLDQAGDDFLEVLTLANAMGNQRVLLIALAGTAALVARRVKNTPDAQAQESPRLALAACLCGATAPYIDTPGVFMWFDTRKLYDDAINQTRLLMSDAVWEEAYSEGQHIPIDRALALAIQALKE